MVTYYAVGDYNFVAEVMDAVGRMAFGTVGATDSNVFIDIFRVAFLIGIIATCIRVALMGGKASSSFGGMITGLVVFMAGMTIGTPVSVHSAYDTSNSRLVGNVPLLIAYPASWMSTVARSVTALLEQNMVDADSMPLDHTLGQAGFVAPLRKLLQLREQLYSGPPGNLCHDADSKTCGGTVNQFDDLGGSIRNYTAVCTHNGVLRGVINPSAVNDASNTFEAQVFEADLLLVEIPIHESYHPPDDPEHPIVSKNEGWEMTCRQATAALRKAIKEGSGYSNNYLNQLNLKLPHQSLESALNLLNGVDCAPGNNAAYATCSQQIALNQVVRYYEDQGWEKVSLTNAQNAESHVLASAIAKKNLSDAAQSNIFARYAIPLISFFEGMTMALAPFMAFALGLGEIGLGVIKKWFLGLAFVMLWTPLLAIVNLYTTMAVAGQLGELVSTGMKANSVSTMLALYPTVENYVATAGTLASTIPALAIMVLYGGSVAMSGVASRITGDSGSINAGLAQPDPISMAPAMAAQSMATHTRAGGWQASGTSNMLPNLGFSSAATAAQRSSNELSSQVSSAVESHARNILSEGVGAKELVSYNRSFAGSAEAGNIKGYTAQRSAAESALKALDFTDTQSRQMADSYLLSGDASLGVSLPGGSGAKGSMGATSSQATTSTVSAARLEAAQEALASTISESTVADYRTKLMATASDGIQQTFERPSSETDMQVLTAADKVSADKAQRAVAEQAWSNSLTSGAAIGNFEQLNGLANSAQGQQLREVGNGTGAFQSAYTAALDDVKKSGAFQALRNNPGNVGQEAALDTAARLMALNNVGGQHGSVGEEARERAAQIIGDYSGVSPVNGLDAGTPPPVSSPVTPLSSAEAANLAEKVEVSAATGHERIHSEEAKNALNRAADSTTNADVPPDGGPPAVAGGVPQLNEMRDQGVSAVTAAGQGYSGEVDDRQVGTIKTQLNSRAQEDPKGALHVMKTLAGMEAETRENISARLETSSDTLEGQMRNAGAVALNSTVSGTDFKDAMQSAAAQGSTAGALWGVASGVADQASRMATVNAVYDQQRDGFVEQFAGEIQDRGFTETQATRLAEHAFDEIMTGQWSTATDLNALPKKQSPQG